MFFEFSKEKRFHTLLVLVIALSQISEVGAWEWFNYWSYRLFHWLPWYDKLPWAITYAQSLAYEATRTIKKILPGVRPGAEELWDVVSVRQTGEGEGEGEDSDEGMTSPEPDYEDTSPRAARRLFGPFPLDPDQQLDVDNEATFTY